jgi:VIT1/CCC1 family predicted Fe2+/Mn2+ transporter
VNKQELMMTGPPHASDLPERDSRFDKAAKMMSGVIEQAIRLQASASDSGQAMRAATAALDAAVKRSSARLDGLAASLERQAFAAVSARFQEAADRAADRTLQRLDDANQAADAAAKALAITAAQLKRHTETAIFELERRWWFYSGIGFACGLALCAVVAYALLR